MSYLYLHIHPALALIINATRLRERINVSGRDGKGGTKCKGESECNCLKWAAAWEGDCTRPGASIKYFNHRLSCYENAFDPDSKELLQNKHFFELAAAQWDSPRDEVQKMLWRRKKKKEAFSLSGFPPSELSSLCCRKFAFHLPQQFCSHSKVKDAMGFVCILSTGNVLILRTQFNQSNRVFQFTKKQAGAGACRGEHHNEGLGLQFSLLFTLMNPKCLQLM